MGENEENNQDNKSPEDLDRIGALINHLKNDSKLNNVDTLEIDKFKEDFPRTYQDSKIKEINTTLSQEPNFEGAPFENPLNIEELNTENLNTEEVDLGDITDEETNDLNIGPEPINTEYDESKPTNTEYDNIEDINFDVPIINSNGVPMNEGSPTLDDIEDDTTQTQNVNDELEELEDQEPVKTNIDENLETENEAVLEPAVEDINAPSTQAENKEKVPYEKFSLENLVKEEDDETSSVVETISEQDLINDFNPKIQFAKLNEEVYQKALILINKFKQENKALLLNVIQENQLTEDQLQIIFDDIITKKNETLIIEKVSNFLLKHDNYFEILERRNKILDAEEIVVEKVFKRANLFYQLKQILLFITVLLILFSTVYFGYDHLLAYRLYNKAVEDIKENKYDESEEYFKLAVEKKIHISRFVEIGDLLLEKKKFELAREKYEYALELAPLDLDAQVSYGHLFFIQKNYEQADFIYQKARAHYINNNKLEEHIGENFIEWGKSKPFQLNAAHQVYSTLINNNPNHNVSYLAKKLEIYSLQNEYYKSKFYYQTITEIEPNERPLKPLSTYADFLIRTYRNTDDNGNPIINQSVLENQEDHYIVDTLEQILHELYLIYPEEGITYFYYSDWLATQKKYPEAIKVAKIGAKKVVDDNSYYFSPDLIYGNLGKYLYFNQSYDQAEVALKNSLEINPENRMANYYLGKILLETEKDFENAQIHFETALNNWPDYDDPEKVDLVYSLGFLNYDRGKSIDLTANEREEKFNDALHYWSLISDKVTDRTEYLIDYCIALSYLQLKKYDLAEVFLEIHIPELEEIFPLYQENPSTAIREIKTRLYILSDLYNNLGVANIEKYFNSQNNQPELLQAGLENFINSISVKDKMGLIKGVPYANFNTMNDYPRANEKFNLTSDNFVKERTLKIADEFIPRSLITHL